VTVLHLNSGLQRTFEFNSLWLTDARRRSKVALKGAVSPSPKAKSTREVPDLGLMARDAEERRKRDKEEAERSRLEAERLALSTELRAREVELARMRLQLDEERRTSEATAKAAAEVAERDKRRLEGEVERARQQLLDRGSEAKAAAARADAEIERLRALLVQKQKENDSEGSRLRALLEERERELQAERDKVEVERKKFFNELKKMKSEADAKESSLTGELETARAEAAGVREELDRLKQQLEGDRTRADLDFKKLTALVDQVRGGGWVVFREGAVEISVLQSFYFFLSLYQCLKRLPTLFTNRPTRS
jgi:chromosome segregation ATPase